MGILEQIEILINNRVTNHEEKIILNFSIQHLLSDVTYILVTGDEYGVTKPKTVYFDKKKEVAEYLNDNCWQILYE